MLGKTPQWTKSCNRVFLLIYSKDKLYLNVWRPKVHRVELSSFISAYKCSESSAKAGTQSPPLI